MQRLAVVFCALALASCSHAAGFAPSPTAPENSTLRTGPSAVGLKHLFSFNGTDGKTPAARLTDVAGVLYGTTYGGGAADTGTVFKITPSGTQRVLHSFEGENDGALPDAGLLNVRGALYGTTINGGGPSDEGIVFKITRSGAESILHRFAAGSDGANPYAALCDVDGVLYGTTAGGGAHSEGTVFRITPSGKERVLYSFGAGSGDGATPIAGLIDVNGALYGTTSYGGGNCGSSGCGSVFKITRSGTETLLYGFKGGKDGATPAAAMVNVGGVLYGTTMLGGSQNDGTVFKVTTSGEESILYSFKGGRDGALPQKLIDRNGIFYGTTSAGGSRNDGTIFAITSSGTETVLYAFKGGTDGAVPRAGLLNVNGTLYGTTGAGGTSRVGTIFSMTP